MSRLKIGKRQNALQAAVADLSTRLTDMGNTFASAESANDLISLESATPERINDLDQNLESIVQQLKTSFEEADMGELSQAQLDAGAFAAMALGNPLGYARTAMKKHDSVSTENLVVMEPTLSGAGGSLDYLDKAAYGIEAFNESEIRQHLAFSIAFNVQAARQDEFSEAFYGTVVVTPDRAGLDISIDRNTVFNEIRHSLTGKATDFDRKGLVDAFRDSTILSNETTEVVPAVVSGGADDNTDKFVASSLVAPSARIVAGVSIDTAPLKMGEEVNLIGISQTTALLGTGVMDHTDDLDGRIGLKKLYIQLSDIDGGGAGIDVEEVVAINVERLPRASFVKSVEGEGREMTLHFRTEDLTLDANTKTISGATPGSLTEVNADNLTVKLGVQITGHASLEYGTVQINATPLSIKGVYDVDGNLLDHTVAGTAKTAVDAFARVGVIGYDLVAARTNANRRTRGLLVDSVQYTERYTIPMGPPISTPSPLAVETDGSDMAALVATARIRNSNNAVTQLLNYTETLKSYVENLKGDMPVPAIEGIGRLLIRPFYAETTIDLPSVVNSISSHEKAEDISAALVNAVRDIAYRMVRDSNYKPALEMHTGNPDARPHLVVGTDPVLERHLVLTGDNRLAGIGMDHDVVSTVDERVQGTIFLAFTRPQADGADPLSFGTHAWMPELTSTVNVSRNGATTREAMVQPRSRHVNNCPIAGKITVTGLTDVLGDVIKQPPAA